jgi:hypothetical protein
MKPLGASRAVITLDPSYIPPAAGTATASSAANNNNAQGARGSSAIVLMSIMWDCPPFRDVLFLPGTL